MSNKHVMEMVKRVCVASGAVVAGVWSAGAAASWSQIGDASMPPSCRISSRLGSRYRYRQ